MNQHHTNCDTINNTAGTAVYQEELAISGGLRFSVCWFILPGEFSLDGFGGWIGLSALAARVLRPEVTPVTTVA